MSSLQTIPPLGSSKLNSVSLDLPPDGIDSVISAQEPTACASNPAACDRGVELRKTFFRLSILAMVLSFVSWIVLMLIMLSLDIQCPHIIYCVIIDHTSMSASCSTNSDGDGLMMNRSILMVITTSWTVLISMVYAISWQWFWRSDHNRLWVHHREDLTKLLSEWISMDLREQCSSVAVWSVLILALSTTLLIEFAVEKYMYFTGGRYLYCDLQKVHVH